MNKKLFEENFNFFFQGFSLFRGFKLGDSFMENDVQTNENIDLLRGEPEKAIKKLAIPMILAMLFIAAYYIVDGMWIVGLGQAAIAGIGFVNPFFMIIVGISMGLSTGASSSVSRFVGAGDHKGASSSAMHSILILIIASVIITILLFFLQKPLLIIFGASGESLSEGLKYGTPLFLGSIGLIFSYGMTGILQGEGDMKRPMYLMGIAVILNAILDPVFIYTLNLGSAGASIATVFSCSIAMIVMLYLIFIKKDTYVDINFKNFKFDSDMAFDILKVGIPSSMEMILQNVALTLYLIFISTLGGDYGVAVFSSAQRLYSFAILPINAIGSTITTVSGSAFGAKNGDYVSRSHLYGSKMSGIFAIVFLVVFVLFSNQLATILAFTPETSHLTAGIASFLQIVGLSLPFASLGISSSYFYRGIGKGTTSLAWTIIREVISTNVLIYVFGVLLGGGLIGVWVGLAAGRSVGGILNFSFARYTIKKIRESVDFA